MSRCGACDTECPPSARFCPGCGVRLAPARDEQRKLCTVVFCDVVGSTALGEAFDAETVREIFLRFFAAMRDVIEAHGGTIQKFAGDAVMAVFGVPVAREDDAERAVTAALAMRRRLESLNESLRADYGVELAVRTGVNTGTVVAGEARRDEALVLGDSVNTAARLEQAAAVGQILVGPLTERLVRHVMVTEPRPPVAAKGKSEPVEVHEVVGPRPGRRRARLDAVPIVDRTDSLAALTATFATVAGGHRPGLVVVVGEAGIGKTRLVREFERRVEATFLHGRCLPYGEGITYWPLAEMVRQAAGIREEDSAEVAMGRLADSLSAAPDAGRVAAYLGQTLGLSPGGPAAEEIAWAARRSLELLAAGGPVVACIDDLQWAEPSFLDLVDRLAATLRDVPVLLLGLARRELTERRPDWPAVPLEALTATDTDTLVARLADLDQPTRARLVDRAGGSPLFVEELVVAVIEEPGTDLPPTIEAVLAARLDRFSRAERYVLERGAVEGLEFHRNAVAELVADKGDVDCDRVLADLAQTGVIAVADSSVTDDSLYRFRHQLIRDAAYHAIPKRVRADLHERLVAWSVRHGPRVAEVEELWAYHYEQAFRCRTEMGVADEHTRRLARAAAGHLRASARRALGRADPRAAVGQLRRAAALSADEPDRRLAVLPELGEALRLAGEPAQAQGVLDEAIARGTASGSAELVTISRVELAILRLTSDSAVTMDQVAGVAAEAVAMFGGGDDPQHLARAWALEGMLQWHVCRAEPMETAFLTALRCLEAADPPSRPAWILRLLALCYYTGPTPVPEAIARCRGLIEGGGGAAAEVAVWASIGALEAMRGEFGLARGIFARCRATGAEFDLAPVVAALCTLTGPVEILAGDLDAAVDLLRHGCAELERLGHTAVLATAAGFLARALEADGQLEAARRWTDTCERTASSDDLASQILWRGVRARLSARAGDTDGAVALAAAGVEIAADTDFLVQHGEALLDLAAVAGAAGDAAGAGTALDRAGALFAAKGHTAHLATMARTGTLDRGRNGGYKRVRPRDPEGGPMSDTSGSTEEHGAPSPEGEVGEHGAPSPEGEVGEHGAPHPER